MDPNNNNNNRANMNYGYNDRNYNAANNRAYPTTPSAFPQPIYQTQGAQDYVDPANPAYSPGYFVASPYPPQQQYPQQQQYAPQQNMQQSPQPAGYQNRMGYANDGTNGLIQQFSNQDLNANRGNFFGRTNQPVQRPRTGGGGAAPGQAQAAHLVPPVPRSPRPPAENEELQRLPDRYSENVHKRGKAAKELVTVFFHENIERARDRNMR